MKKYGKLFLRLKVKEPDDVIFTGSGSIEIPVLCMLISGEASMLEVLLLFIIFDAIPCQITILSD